ncbi:MAG: leucyl/phenylalanyl-tRNA--protein transferase [Cardiobacteriaceae bacterium]|nr:leucyl/phenylalanyl-tRNA--protein transferase [Cardiobacteriaceae bacterium]
MHTTKYHFPSANSADARGLLAQSDFISASLAFSAHSQGIFPWYNPGNPILWWSPDPRAIIPTATIHTSRSLHKLLRTMPYHLSLDTAFTAVIDHCAKVHGETWITDDMRSTYLTLHDQGRAHSCELWQEGTLIGGLYGVALERIFCGESMFSLRPSASKIVLVQLCAHLAAMGIDTLDTQFLTPHLISMGAKNIPRDEYLSRLTENPDAHRGRWHLC